MTIEDEPAHISPEAPVGGLSGQIGFGGLSLATRCCPLVEGQA